MVRKFSCILLIFILAFSNYGISQENKFSYKIQISDLLLVKPQSPFYSGNVIRIIPQINLEKTIREKYKFDTEFSMNGFLNCEFADKKFYTDPQISLYRAWLRYSGKKFELRLGLQKLNFGSAQVLRPLMWFDGVDPRDPQKLTNGVYGGLFRYYFENNANFWFWTLFGNKNLKGLEFTPTDKNFPEFGGRMQYPIKKGEISLTFDFRKTDLSSFAILNQTGSEPELKFGLDGKVDIGIGLWIENSFSSTIIDKDTSLQTLMSTLGADYTFNVGNGLGATLELFYVNSKFNFSKQILANGFFSSIIITYPITILDNLNSVTMFDITGKNLYQFIGWQRTYDHISFNLMLSLNPDSGSDNILKFRGNQFFSGNYLQFLLSYNL
jgi:hypothetical protein